MSVKKQYPLVIMYTDHYGMEDDYYYFVWVDDKRYFNIDRRVDFKTIYRCEVNWLNERYGKDIVYIHPKYMNFRRARKIVKYATKSIYHDEAKVINYEDNSIWHLPGGQSHKELTVSMNSYLHDDYHIDMWPQGRAIYGKKEATRRRRYGQRY